MPSRTPGIVGDNLSRLLRERKIAKTELARRSGVSRVTIWQIENKQVEPDLSTVTALAGGLGVSLAEMLQEQQAEIAIDPIIEAFERSDFAKMLRPPLSDEERDWLRSLSSIVWTGLPPATPEGILHLVNWRRSAG